MKKEIVDHYGLIAQLDMCEEECAELIKACSKYKRVMFPGYYANRKGTTPKEAYAAIVEEIAHVTNTLRSVQYLLGITDGDVESMIEASDNITLDAMGHKV